MGRVVDRIRNGGGKLRGQWKKQTKVQRKTLLILGVLVAVALVLSLPSAALSGDWTGLFLNLGTELGGAVVTFILIDRIVGGDEETERVKQRLNREMGSNDNGIALNALMEANEHGWLHDGTFRGMGWMEPNWQGAWLVGADLQKIGMHKGDLRDAKLVGANLQAAFLSSSDLRGAKMRGANLQGAELQWANFQGSNTDLWAAQLQGAKMWGAKMQGTILTVADLRGAELIRTDLSDTNLAGADLRGVSLQGANLKNAELAEIEGMRYEAKFDETTWLPDNTLWTPETDMGRFTNPSHPNFWRSDNSGDPSYKGLNDQ
ncbi:MAG TPA: pentapeptide repeat-containing protein [Aggregatilineaceae bacterium]|nr:pentapeptide repeat-containing protein [Aggregatilineaceae bacterium]